VAREISVIFAALTGMICLTERLGTPQVATAVVVAAGLVLISTWPARQPPTGSRQMARPGHPSLDEAAAAPGHPPRGRHPLRLT